MIEKQKINDYTVLTRREDAGRYKRLLQEYWENGLQSRIRKTLKHDEETCVYLVQSDDGLCVVKIFEPRRKQTERFFKSLIKQDYYEKLFTDTYRVCQQGVTSVNDFYLLAEKKHLTQTVSYIMIIEYIDGMDLREYQTFHSDWAEKIIATIEELHGHDMVAGDIHGGNFIVQNGQIRLIDLSGKRASMLRKAEDWQKLEQRLCVMNNKRSGGYYLLKFKQKCRLLIRKLRGKA